MSPRRYALPAADVAQLRARVLAEVEALAATASSRDRADASRLAVELLADTGRADVDGLLAYLLSWRSLDSVEDGSAFAAIAAGFVQRTLSHVRGVSLADALWHPGQEA